MIGGPGNRREAAVVGGGPAGLATALALAGLKVPCVLFERGRIGETIRCAEGLLDPAAVVPVDKTFIRTRVRRAILTVGDERFTFALGSRSRFAVIDRTAWQQSLADKARTAGVEVVENHPVDPKTLKNRFRYVVDARGRAAYATFQTPPGAFGFGLQWTLEGDFSPWREALEVEIVSNPPGYFWVFPKGDSLAHVGFGRLCPAPRGMADAWELLSDFLQRRGLADACKIRKSGGWMPLGPIRPFVEGSLLRVGDAGGFGSPLHGGGIDGAWLSGEAAAAAIACNQPEAFPAAVNQKLGLLRKVERRLLDAWQRSGDAPVLRAARRLQNAGPLLRLSLRLLAAPGVATAVRGAVGSLKNCEYYRSELELPPGE